MQTIVQALYSGRLDVTHSFGLDAAYGDGLALPVKDGDVHLKDDLLTDKVFSEFLEGRRK